jgi:hypothetical protein
VHKFHIYHILVIRNEVVARIVAWAWFLYLFHQLSHPEHSSSFFNLISKLPRKVRYKRACISYTEKQVKSIIYCVSVCILLQIIVHFSGTHLRQPSGHNLIHKYLYAMYIHSNNVKFVVKLYDDRLHKGGIIQNMLCLDINVIMRKAEDSHYLFIFN